MSIEQVFWTSVALLIGLEVLSEWLDHRANVRAHQLRDHLLRCDPDEIYDEAGHVSSESIPSGS